MPMSGAMSIAIGGGRCALYIFPTLNISLIEGFDKKKTTLGGITYTYCKPCDKCLAIRESYRKHLFVIHRINWRLIQQNLLSRL